jgi:signal transduction histidine kinase
MKRDSCRHGGPPGWPAKEPWPPQHGRFGMDRQARARFLRRAGAAFAIVFLLMASVAFVAAWLGAERLGLHSEAPLVGAVIALILVGAMVAGMFRGMRRFAFPLGQVIDAAGQVASGDYSVRVREYGPPPMRALAHSFNAMTEQLQNADRLRRDLMADLAHELRTPLAVMQGRVEGLLDGVYARDDAHLGEVLSETRILSRLIEDLRTLALSDSGALPLQIEATDVRALVKETLRGMSASGTAQHVTLNAETDADEIIADCDGIRIREVLTNLVTNATRHTPAGGRIVVTVRDGTDAITVTVRDTGYGMTADELSRMFDRFYKGRGSRGSGLGLAIAKGIVAAHGGDITATSAPGTGTSVTFTLPRRHQA